MLLPRVSGVSCTLPARSAASPTANATVRRETAQRTKCAREASTGIEPTDSFCIPRKTRGDPTSNVASPAIDAPWMGPNTALATPTGMKKK